MPSGVGKFFGATDELLGQGDLKIDPLLTSVLMTAEVPLKLPDAPQKGTVGYIRVQLRLRFPLNAEPEAPGQLPFSRAGEPSAAHVQSKPKAAAAARASRSVEEEEDDMEFANRIVSYNVLDFEIKQLQTGMGQLETTGAVVPLAFGNRLQVYLPIPPHPFPSLPIPSHPVLSFLIPSRPFRLMLNIAL